jgi:peptidoglycan DL-endopeptidase CwlO
MAVVTGFTIGAGVLVAAPAAAAPVPSRSALDRRISDTASQLEVVIEQYNGTKVALLATKAREARVRMRLVPLHRQVAEARASVGRIAANVYESTAVNPFTALIDAASTPQALGRLSTMNQLAHAQRAAITSMYAAAHAFMSRQKDLARLDAQQSAAFASLRDKKATIIAQIAKLKALRLTAYGPAGLQATAPASDYVPVFSPDTAGRVVKFAYDQIGKPYRWAAAGPSAYDCSGLVLAAWRTVGVALPHNAAMQYRTVAHISRAELKPGDLVFYFTPIHHVSMYIGADKVIQAPEYGHPVQISDIEVGPIHGYGRPG